MELLERVTDLRLTGKGRVVSVVQFHPLGRGQTQYENLSVSLTEHNEVTECVIKT